jgi:murein DD-endopeptidase MepM/ murein hydrolase activator NlpD
VSRRQTVIAAVLAAVVVAGFGAPIGTALARTSPPSSPTPTETPSETPTPTPTLTFTTTPTTTPPTTEPTTTPPTTTTRPPTSPPATTPLPPSPPTTPPPTGDEFIDSESAAAFAKATEKLRAATEALRETQQLLVGADARLSMSMGQVLRARTAATMAANRADVIAEEVQTERQLLAIAKDSIAGVARQTYQDGVIGAFGSVMSADGPADFVNRAASLNTITTTSGHAIDLVNALPERIARLQDQLDAATAERRTARADAEGSSKAYDQLAARVSGASVRITQLQTQADDALEAARLAIPADQALAAQRGQESSRLASEIVAAQRALAAAGDTVEGTGSFFRPATGVVTSPYGWRYHPILHYYKIHTGVDFDGADGVVYAADSGTVIMTVYNAAYGNVTVIDHGTSGGRFEATFYAHQSGFFVHPGDVVTKGQPIGAVGATGYATGPHLHFEVRLDGVPVDPAGFLDY